MPLFRYGLPVVQVSSAWFFRAFLTVSCHREPQSYKLCSRPLLWQEMACILPAIALCLNIHNCLPRYVLLLSRRFARDITTVCNCLEGVRCFKCSLTVLENINFLIVICCYTCLFSILQYIAPCGNLVSFGCCQCLFYLYV